MKFSTVSILAAIVVNSASAFTIPLQNARMSSTMTSSLRMKGDSPFVGYDSPAPDAANCPPDQPIPPPPPATPIPAGYVGTFAESNPNFAYPKVLPDLTSIPVTTNLANIDKLTRQQKVEWPEFSWQMIQEDDSSRLYMTFAEYVSRMGYDDEGKVWSVICPQQGFGTNLLGNFNIEVTVTGVRGWTEETARESCFDIGVVGQIWISNNKETCPMLKVVEKFIFEFSKHEMPFEKSEAIQVETHNRNSPREPLFRVSNGMSPDYRVPLFKQHWEEAYAVINLSVQIGQIKKRDEQSDIVTDFNQLVLDIFNFGSGNMLQACNVLSWNIWLQSPELVDKVEWKAHAEYWRKSLDIKHKSPVDNQGSAAMNFDGLPVTPYMNLDYQQSEIDLIKAFFAKHSSGDVLAKFLQAVDIAETETLNKMLKEAAAKGEHIVAGKIEKKIIHNKFDDIKV